jgi:hypothetical protein
MAVILPRVHYNNYLQADATTVTVSSEDADYPGAQAYNDRSYNGWRPTSAGSATITADLGSARDVSAFCYARTTLAANSGTIALAYSDTGTSGPWTVMMAAATPTDERPTYRFAATETHRYWQVQITSTPLSQINLLSFGDDFQIDQGQFTSFTPPFLNRSDRVEVNVTEAGNFVGSSLISEETELQATYTHLSQAFIRDTWEAFMLHARTKAWWYLWDSVGRPSEAAWCYPSAAFPAPSNSDYGFMTAGVKAKCVPNVSTLA